MTLKITRNQATTDLHRRENLDGQEYLVVPVIAVREGVLNGELLLSEEIGKYTDSWNGIPLPISHPTENGAPVSANRPDLIEAYSIGRFFNASFDGNSLRGELWLDVNKANRVGGKAMETLNRVEQGQPLEVSTAYFNDLEPVSGTFNGVQYSGIQRNLRPDHLALLPDEIGACSWEMGCGAPRVNSSKGGDNKLSIFQRMKEMAMNLFSANSEDVSTNEADFRTIQNNLESAMTQATGDAMRFFIRRVYNNHFIYQESTANGFDGRLWQRSYTVDDDGKITLGDQFEVRHVESYEPVNPSANTSSASEGDKDGESPKPASAANNQKGSEQQVKTTNNNCTCGGGASHAQNQEATAAVAAVPAAAPAVEAPAANTEVTMEQWISAIPDPEVREFIVNSQAKQKAHRNSLIESLAANSHCAFEKAELEAMSLNSLEKLSKSMEALNVEDYSGAAPAPSANSSDDAIPAPPSVILSKPESK